jgi:hypothetical protein
MTLGIDAISLQLFDVEVQPCAGFEFSRKESMGSSGERNRLLFTDTSGRRWHGDEGILKTRDYTLCVKHSFTTRPKDGRIKTTLTPHFYLNFNPSRIRNSSGLNYPLASPEEARVITDYVINDLRGAGVVFGDHQVTQVHIAKDMEMDGEFSEYRRILFDILQVKYSKPYLKIKYPTSVYIGNESQKIIIYEKGLQLAQEKFDTSLLGKNIFRLEWRIEGHQTIMGVFGNDQVSEVVNNASLKFKDFLNMRVFNDGYDRIEAPRAHDFISIIEQHSIKNGKPAVPTLLATLCLMDPMPELDELREGLDFLEKKRVISRHVNKTVIDKLREMTLYVKTTARGDSLPGKYAEFKMKAVTERMLNICS